MLSRAKSFLDRSKPLAAFRETRGLVAGSLTGILFGLVNILRVPIDAPIFGKAPAIATATLASLAALFRMKRNLDQFESPELRLQETLEKEFLIKSTSTLILNEINSLTLAQRSAFFEKTGIHPESWDELTTAASDTQRLENALKEMYKASANSLEKYSFSAYCGIIHFFGHFSEAMIAQVFTDRFDLFDYRKGASIENILFWGLLVPFGVYNGTQMALETKATYDEPDMKYLRQTVLSRITLFKKQTPTLEPQHDPEQSMQRYVALG